MKNIKKSIPTITDENEKEYWIEYKKTLSPQIKEALINRYAPLVKFEAFKIKSYLNMNIVYTYVIKNIIDFEDLVGFGFFGILYAVERYNPNKDIKFKTYASLRIQGAIYDELRKMLPRISRIIYKDIYEIQKARETLEIKLKREAKPEEIAKTLGITVDKYNKIMRYTLPDYIISLDEVSWHNEPYTLLKNKETKEEFINILKKLPQKEYDVLKLYYYKELTLKEIGNIFETSERRVAQIHGKAIQDLRDILMKK